MSPRLSIAPIPPSFPAGIVVMIRPVGPGFLLRLTDDEQKRAEWKRFLADLRMARDLAA